MKDSLYREYEKIKTGNENKFFEKLDEKGLQYSYVINEDEDIKKFLEKNYNRNVKEIKVNRSNVKEWTDSKGEKQGITKVESVEMALGVSEDESDFFVCDGAMLNCPHLEPYIKTSHDYSLGNIQLLVKSKNIKFMGEDPIATESDKEFYISGQNCLKGGKCELYEYSFWKQDTLSQEVIVNDKRAVLMSSKLCCGKYSPEIEISIWHNGQDFTDFEGQKNEFLKFYEGNPWMFNIGNGFLDLFGNTPLNLDSILVLFESEKTSKEKMKKIIDNYFEENEKAKEKIKQGFEASPFNSLTINGQFLMLKGQILGNKELEKKGKEMRDNGIKFPPLEGSIEKINKVDLKKITKDGIDVVISQPVDAAKNVIYHPLEYGGSNIGKTLFSEVKDSLKPKNIGIGLLKEAAKKATMNDKVYNFINDIVPENRNLLKQIYPSNEHYERSIDYFKKKRYITIIEEIDWR